MASEPPKIRWEDSKLPLRLQRPWKSILWSHFKGLVWSGTPWGPLNRKRSLPEGKQCIADSVCVCRATGYYTIPQDSRTLENNARWLFWVPVVARGLKLRSKPLLQTQSQHCSQVLLFRVPKWPLSFVPGVGGSVIPTVKFGIFQSIDTLSPNSLPSLA